MSAAEAALTVREMTGHFRIPDALKRADSLARGLVTPETESLPLRRR
jgi:hypothetical protein